MKPVSLISATRHSLEGFEKTLLGKSLPRLDGKITCTVIYNNRAGLSEIWNRFIIKDNYSKILVFLHDDVFIDDYWVDVRLNEAIAVYDVVGITGLSYRITSHDWDGISPWDCGTVAETPNSLWRPRDNSPHPAYALDGQFIAINTQRIMDKGVRWDEQFLSEFHDIDFCWQCVDKGLRVGVWPIAITHIGKGEGGQPEWIRLRERFKRKWNL